MKENEFAESVLHKVPYPLTAQELINGLTKLEIYDIALEFVNSKPFTTRADKHLYIMDFITLMVENMAAGKLQS